MLGLLFNLKMEVYFHLEHWLTFTGPHSVLSQKTELFILNLFHEINLTVPMNMAHTLQTATAAVDWQWKYSSIFFVYPKVNTSEWWNKILCDVDKK
jgi:hypothetical protein